MAQVDWNAQMQPGDMHPDEQMYHQDATASLATGQGGACQ